MEHPKGLTVPERPARFPTEAQSQDKTTHPEERLSAYIMISDCHFSPLFTSEGGMSPSAAALRAASAHNECQKHPSPNKKSIQYKSIQLCLERRNCKKLFWVLRRMQRFLVRRWTRTAWLYCPKANMSPSLIRASLYVRLKHPPHTHLCATKPLLRKPRNRLLEADRKKRARMERFCFPWLTRERNLCEENRRRPSRAVKPISINPTRTQTFLYNSGEEVDAGSAELALPPLPPPFNQGVLSETEIPVGKLLKLLFPLFVFFPPL